MEPVLKWPGGKRRLKSIMESLPFADVGYRGFQNYYEPFGGGGGVIFALTPPRAVLSDLNPHLILTYEVIRDSPTDLMRLLDELYSTMVSLPHRESQKEFYLSTRASRPKEPIERAARFIFLNKTAFNGLYRENSRGEFNVSFGCKDGVPLLYDRLNLLAVSEYQSTVTLLCAPYQDILGLVRNEDFVFLDPPYHPVSVTANFTAYTAGGFSWLDQIELAAHCDEIHNNGSYFVLTNSYCDETIELYGRAWTHPIEMGRSISAKLCGRGKVKEVLYTNAQQFCLDEASLKFPDLSGAAIMEFTHSQSVRTRDLNRIMAESRRRIDL
jgi:DNA adenine methylase